MKRLASSQPLAFFFRLALVGATMTLLSPASWAMSWTKLVETQTMTFYVNRNAIEREGDIRRIWEMQDLKAADPEGVVSRRYQNEYDCKEKMHRIGRMTSFSGHKLSGKPMFDVPDWGYWRKIPPDGVFVVSYVMLCVQ